MHCAAYAAGTLVNKSKYESIPALEFHKDRIDQYRGRLFPRSVFCVLYCKASKGAQGDPGCDFDVAFGPSAYCCRLSCAEAGGTETCSWKILSGSIWIYDPDDLVVRDYCYWGRDLSVDVQNC